MTWAKRARFYALAVAVPAGSASLLGFFGSSWWRLDQLANFRVQYAIALLLSAICLLAARNRKLAAGAGILFSLNAVVIAPCFVSQTAAPCGALEG